MESFTQALEQAWNNYVETCDTHSKISKTCTEYNDRLKFSNELIKKADYEFKTANNNYESFLNFSCKLNPFKRFPNFEISKNFKYPTYKNRIENLQSVILYAQCICSDLIKIKSGCVTNREATLKILEFRHTMLNHYIKEWFKTRRDVAPRLGGAGEEDIPLPSVEYNFSFDKNPVFESAKNLNNKIENIRKLVSTCRKLYEYYGINYHDPKLEVKIEVLWEIYSAIFEKFPYVKEF